MQDKPYFGECLYCSLQKDRLNVLPIVLTLLIIPDLVCTVEEETFAHLNTSAFTLPFYSSLGPSYARPSPHQLVGNSVTQKAMISEAGMVTAYAKAVLVHSEPFLTSSLTCASPTFGFL